MKIIEKKISMIIEANLGDLLTQAEMVDAEVKNISRKSRKLGWDKKKTKEAQIMALSQLKRAAKNAVSSAVQSSSVIANLERDSGGDLDKIFVWQATGNNVCPDCVQLHGTTKTMGEWLSFGLPGSAPTVCGANCVCELVEVDRVLKNPIVVKRGKRGVRGGRGKIEAIFEKNKKPVVPEELHKPKGKSK